MELVLLLWTAPDSSPAPPCTTLGHTHTHTPCTSTYGLLYVTYCTTVSLSLSRAPSSAWAPRTDPTRKHGLRSTSISHTAYAQLFLRCPRSDAGELEPARLKQSFWDKNVQSSHPPGSNECSICIYIRGAGRLDSSPTHFPVLLSSKKLFAALPVPFLPID